MEIKRDLYLSKLIARRFNSAIKIISGIRRCGKSYLLFKLYYDYLLSIGIKKDYIITIELDDNKYEELHNKNKLRDYIESKIIDDNDYYLFIDEIQLCPGFESVLNGLNRNLHLDIYVTGSNSKFLSSDVVSEFRGRGDEIRVHPLSFKEFFTCSNLDYYDAFNEYFTFGGMPFLVNKKTNEEKITYLNNLFKFTYLRDIVERHNIANDLILNNLIDVLASSIGSLSNPKRLANTFKSNSINTNEVSLNNYINYLIDAFIINKVNRYDVKGKQYISTPYKFYFEDIGLRNARLGFRQQDEGHIIENIVYNELKIRGYNIDIGVLSKREKGEDNKLLYKQLEVDFVCNFGFEKYYIQVASSIYDYEKMMQESKSLTMIRDSFKKIIIVNNNLKMYKTDDGIIVVSLKDFLLDEDILQKL